MTRESPGFEADGWAHRARIGLLVPDNDVGPESECRAMAPAGVSFHASRFRFPVGEVTDVGARITTAPIEYVAAAGPLDEALTSLVAAPVHLIALAFSSTSYVGGVDGDRTLVERLSQLTDGRPMFTTGQAIAEALQHVGARRVMLVDPPWFPAELTALGARWLTDNGFDVVCAQAAGLPSGQGNIHPGGLYEWVRGNLPPETDAVVIAGNGFRAAGVVRSLEADTGTSVITANSALLWRALRTMGLPTREIARYGHLFTANSLLD